MAFFARFTERAQRALVAAQKEAAAMHRNYVGTEHLLLGIMRDPGTAALILNAVSEEELRATIVQMVGEGDEQAARQAGIPFVHAAYGFGTAIAPNAVLHSFRDLPQLARTMFSR